MKILIIDDDVSFRELLRTMLTKFSSSFYKFEVSEATNLENALIVAKETSPDIVFFDLFLPDAELHEAYHFIGELKASTFIIAVSNTDRQDVVVDSMLAGARDFVSKKMLLNPDSLKERMEKICDIIKKEGDDDRKMSVTDKTVELTRHMMNDNDLKNLIDFCNWAKYNLIPELKKIDKLHKTVYESNGSPSLKQEIETIKRDLTDLKKIKDESVDITVDGDDEEKKNGPFWIGLFGFLGTIATGLIALLYKIFYH